MWDMIYGVHWEVDAVNGAVALFLLVSLLAAMNQSRRLSKRIGVLQKELNVMTDCSMGMGDKLILLEAKFRQGGAMAVKKVSEGHHSASVLTSGPEASIASSLANESRYRKANQLLTTGAAAEQVMSECGVSKAELDLMRLLERSGGHPLSR